MSIVRYYLHPNLVRYSDRHQLHYNNRNYIDINTNNSKFSSNALQLIFLTKKKENTEKCSAYLAILIVRATPRSLLSLTYCSSRISVSVNLTFIRFRTVQNKYKIRRKIRIQMKSLPKKLNLREKKRFVILFFVVVTDNEFIWKI